MNAKWVFIFGFCCLVVFGCKKTTESTESLFWAEEFDGASLDLSVWNYKLGDGCPNLCGWGNNEPQIYTKENVTVSGGTLKIKATLDDTIYHSSRITTEKKFEFQYGRLETRVKLPKGAGLWPAVWMLGSNIKEKSWPLCGEIDVVEWIGRDPDSLFTSLHTKASHGNTINTKKTFIADAGEWHTYGCDWNEDRIIFSLDGKTVYTFQPKEKTEEIYPFTQPFYLLVNMAVGGNFGGAIDDSIFPQTLEVDYIRVYK